MCIAVGICLTVTQPPVPNTQEPYHQLETFGDFGHIYTDLTPHQDYDRHPQQPHRDPKGHHRDHRDVQGDPRDHRGDPKGDLRADPGGLMASSNDMCMEHAQVAQIQRSS